MSDENDETAAIFADRDWWQRAGDILGLKLFGFTYRLVGAFRDPADHDATVNLTGKVAERLLALSPPTETSVDGFVAAVVALAEAGIESDLQELLVRGNPMRGIKPNALLNAIEAYNGAATLPEAPIPEQTDEGGGSDLSGIMAALGKSQTDLAKVLNSRSRASEYLSGKRELSKSAMRLINSAWGVSADVLLGISPPITDHVEADVMGGDKPEWKEMAGNNSRQAAIRAVALVDLVETGRVLLDKLPAHWHDDATVEFRDAVAQAEKLLASAPKPSGDESGKEGGE